MLSSTPEAGRHSLSLQNVILMSTLLHRQLQPELLFLTLLWFAFFMRHESSKLLTLIPSKWLHLHPNDMCFVERLWYIPAHEQCFCALHTLYYCVPGLRPRDAAAAATMWQQWQGSLLNIMLCLWRRQTRHRYALLRMATHTKCIYALKTNNKKNNTNKQTENHKNTPFCHLCKWYAHIITIPGGWWFDVAATITTENTVWMHHTSERAKDTRHESKIRRRHCCILLILQRAGWAGMTSSWCFTIILKVSLQQ